MEGHKVRKKLPAIIGITVLVAVIILAVIFQIRKDTFKFNSSPVIGNTAGNIYNKGLSLHQTEQQLEQAADILKDLFEPLDNAVLLRVIAEA